ncbi:MAG: hypothetical protein AAB919_03495 [Patescibacteria group bacterium]
MKIVLASALFPPDIASPAPYVKELTRRLAGAHEVAAVVYGSFPERVEGARIVAVSKRRPLPLRLISFTLALWRAARHADILYIENGASVELPALLIKWLVRTPLIIHFGDPAAKKYFSQKMLLRRAAGTITESPPGRPEILPFAPRPEAALAAYEQSWSGHVRMLEEKFAHAK